MHRRGARRSGAGWMRHPGSNPPRFPVHAAARRRPRAARRDAGAIDARRRCLGTTCRLRIVSERPLKVRLKSKKNRTVSQKRWLERQLNDPYVARAKREGMRSRAAYKLIEIDDKYHLLRPGSRVVDLGAAPGGWSDIAAKRVGAGEGRGKVVAIDVLDTAPIVGVTFRQIDFLDPKAPAALQEML